MTPVEIVGTPARVARIVTGLYSFDHAFVGLAGKIGFPMSLIEVAGPTGCGKSTSAYSLCGLLSTLIAPLVDIPIDIALADFEGYDPEFLVAVLEHAGFDGKIKAIQEDTDGKVLDELVASIKGDFSLGIFDSVAAISPLSEIEGKIEEANWGRRAILVNQFCRKIIRIIRDDPLKAVFMINHVHASMGGFGTVTPGGVSKNYLSAVTMRVKRKEEFDDQSYVIEGTVRKNRFGYRNRKFYLFVLAEKGIHLGLTAMYDCFLLGLAERGKTIKIGDQKFGYLTKLVDKAQAGENEIFEPFLDLLKGCNEP